jgi:hypothetical protein
MDRITSSLLKAFVAQENLGMFEESETFERFGNFCQL